MTGSRPLIPCEASPSAIAFTSSGCSLQKAAIWSNDSAVLSTSQTAVAFGMRSWVAIRYNPSVRPLRWRGTWAKPQFPGNHGLYIVFLSPEQEWLSGLSNIENDLADMSSLLHSSMRCPGIVQRKVQVHHGSHAALRQKRQDL